MHIYIYIWKEKHFININVAYENATMIITASIYYFNGP